MNQRTWKQTVAYLVAWLASSIATAFTLWITGASIVQAVIWYGAHRSKASLQQELVSGSSFGWTVELVSQVTLLVLVCLGLTLAIWLEDHYRRGVDKGLLAKRFVRISFMQLGVTIVGLVVLLLARLL